MSADLAGLIDRLGAQAIECRALLTEMRAAARDCRAAAKELDESRKAWADAVTVSLDERLMAEIAPKIDEARAIVGMWQDKYLDEVQESFQKAVNNLVFGNEQGRGQSVFAMIHAKIDAAIDAANEVRFNGEITPRIGGHPHPVDKLVLPPAPRFGKP